jgi:hypothetical protein
MKANSGLSFELTASASGGLFSKIDRLIKKL